MLSAHFFLEAISKRLVSYGGFAMELNEMKETFIRSAVRVVYRDGLVKATTKSIAAEAKLNEAYIYKCFQSKDALLSEAFIIEDANLAELITEKLSIMLHTELTWRERAFTLWHLCWEFILEFPDDFFFYIRYYYSVYCVGEIYDKHVECYRPIIERIRPSFEEDANVDMLVHQILGTMLTFGIKVLNGEYSHDEKTSREVFDIVYNFIVPYIKPERLI